MSEFYCRDFKFGSFKTPCPSGQCSKCKRDEEIAKRKLSKQTAALGVPDILEGMAATFRERNAVYGDNWKMVGELMDVMFPQGIGVTTHAKSLKATAIPGILLSDYDVWHLFELMIVKLSRFAISGLTHEDSVHDLAVYAAMIEAILKQRREQA